MPKRSSKHATLERRMVVPTQGMDLSIPANAIDDNMLSRAYNWWYEPERGLCVRQGLSRADITHLSTPIVALHPYVDASGALRILAASDGKLKELDAGAWADVVSITTTDHVSMITFNGQAIIADSAGTGLIKYDGTTAATITDSPAKPMCVSQIANRVVCASADVPDYVYFSGANDLDDWATADPGTALTIAAGFGDGYAITGFAVIYDLLVVSKVKRDSTGAIVGRKLYAINTAGNPSEWSVKRISSENAAMRKGGMVAVGEAVYLVDTNGFKAVSPTPNGQYGDIGVDPMVGVRINKLVAQIAKRADNTVVAYLPSLAQVWCVVGSVSQARIVVYHPVFGAWTEIAFGSFVPLAVCEVGNTVYLAGSDGALYTLSNQSGDELAADTLTDIYATLRTRVFEGLGGDLILKKSKMVLESLRVSTILLEAYLPNDDSRVSIGSVSLGTGSANTPVYEAFDDVYDADYTLSDNKSRDDTTFYDGPRSSSMSLQVRVIGGRVVLNSLTAEFAVVGR
ncbi:MAG: hypothetical protein RBR38_10335 [Desulfomicrobium apsheronum]|nr:hypothetical protein [Desulfomicrobium apsheronum]